MAELKLYNTMSRQKMLFEPLNPSEVKLYTCGPTVYNFAHIGNLRTYVFEDLLRRVLEFNGYQVSHVMNITDVGHLTSDADEGEDKMAKGAKREKTTVWDLAEKYTQAFLEDMDRLNFLKPHIKPKATDHIDTMIDQIKQLEANGLTYQAGGNVYFDTSMFPDYGKLAQLEKQELQAGARIEVDKNKKNPHDFVLWFTKSKFGDQEMQWDSPWGRGYPGWHIECSAMSMKYLGQQMDIHCGGIDHIPVHHTNEIAQAEGATNVRPWVNYWMHGNFLVLKDKSNTNNELIYPERQICSHCDHENIFKNKWPLQKINENRVNVEEMQFQCRKCNKWFDLKAKMAKSGENFLTLQALMDKGYDALDYRYFCLQAHYRKELTFSWECMDAAKNGLRKLREKVCNLSDNEHQNPEGAQTLAHLQGSFTSSINDDLNLPQALATTWDLIDDPNISDADKLATIKKFDTVLGLKLDEKKDVCIPEEIQNLIIKRNEARKNKDWETSDKIRDEIEAAGFTVKDGPGGTEVVEK